MRTVVIVQARCGSARLPGKALLPLAGRPMITHVLERAQAIAGVDAVVLATSVNPRDDGLAAVADAMPGVAVYRGSEWDVLRRVREAALAYVADIVVRVTGDCPLLAPDVAEDVLALWQRGGYRYAWNDVQRSGYPDGTDVEVFDVDLLRMADAAATVSSDREHVTSWMRRAILPNRIASPYAPEDRSHLKLSIDREADYVRVQAVYGYLERGRLLYADTLAAAACAGLPEVRA